MPNAQIHNVYGLIAAQGHLGRHSGACAAGDEPAQLHHRARRLRRHAALRRRSGRAIRRRAGTILQIYIPQVLNQGLSGIPISGCDIGGFANGPIPSGTTGPTTSPTARSSSGITNYELLTRWMHVGAFLPWYRNHYNGYTKQFQEAYAYGEPVPTNCRKYVELRYRHAAALLRRDVRVDADGYADLPRRCSSTTRRTRTHTTGWTPSSSSAATSSSRRSSRSTSPRTRRRDRPAGLPAGAEPVVLVQGQHRASSTRPSPAATLISDWFAGLDQVPIYVRAGAILPMRELEQ